MRLNVIFSNEAVDAFDAIGEQIRIRWGDKEANEFRKRAYKVVDIISKFPLIFQAANKMENIRKAFVHKNCPMFYSVSDARMAVLFFWENRQDAIFH